MPRAIPFSERKLQPEPAPNRKRWTRKECEFLRENGLLTGRYELIEGEIVSKLGQKPPHAFVIIRLTGWLVRVFGGDYVRIQLPVNVADQENETNEPEPDAAALGRPAVEFLQSAPDPADLLLVIEVSDTTARFDLTTRALLYSRAGIREYWVIDLPGRQLIAHHGPTPQGYQETTAYDETESLAPLARPDAAARVADLLPPA